MKWIAISGSWQNTSPKVDEDVRRKVGRIMLQGNGIVTGGALSVDYFAVDEALKNDPGAQKIRIFLPSTLEIYAKHYRTRASEMAITTGEAEKLITQLMLVKAKNSSAVIENPLNKEVTEKSYFERNSEVVNVADGLLAFWVNKSKGVADAIEKAQKRGIPIKIYEYNIE